MNTLSGFKAFGIDSNVIIAFNWVTVVAG